MRAGRVHASPLGRADGEGGGFRIRVKGAWDGICPLSTVIYGINTARPGARCLYGYLVCDEGALQSIQLYSVFVYALESKGIHDFDQRSFRL